MVGGRVVGMEVEEFDVVVCVVDEDYVVVGRLVVELGIVEGLKGIV